MSIERTRILSEVAQRSVRRFLGSNGKLNQADSITKIFGANLFGINEIKRTVPHTLFVSFMDSLQADKQVSAETTNAIAEVVKNWAIKKGATHYCHWFHPQTGTTAEKHDAMIGVTNEGLPIEEFTGTQLVRGEPDASSFPNGGMRTTFEARGYTAWDPTSPIFIVETENGKILTIPSVFISYTGEALDTKTPLLRSMKAVDAAARDLLAALPESLVVDDVQAITGPEQEYFLVDKAFYCRRPDLVLTGRMLGGLPSTRGQAMDDHYFGSIPSRVQAFMQEVEYELYKIGVVAKTRHNEVAPSQFELAVLHQNANVATDQNQMVMAMLDKVAERHNFSLLLHEKPFSGINGSGKHINWSLVTDTGINLCSPGNTPVEYMRFMSVLASILHGVNEFGGLMRASIGSLGNDHRLGANEAPPAIISVFLGTAISHIIDQIKAKDFNIPEQSRSFIQLGLKAVPRIEQDNTDRNRTSPFAFTGNKFEYRPAGSAASVSFPTTVLNTITAYGMRRFVSILKEKQAGEKDPQSALLQALHDSFRETERVVFNGNSYSDAWHNEASRRGLPNYRTLPDALVEFESKKVRTLFEDSGVLSQNELTARHMIVVERYIKGFFVECQTLIQMVNQHVLPAAESQLAAHYRALLSVRAIGMKTYPTLSQKIRILAEYVRTISANVARLETALAALGQKKSEHQQASWINIHGLAQQQAIEAAVGEVEARVGDKYWSLPKAHEMLHL